MSDEKLQFSDLEKLKGPLVCLYDLVGLGLILKVSSGVCYFNQTGGYACMQPHAEGVFVPLYDEIENLEAILYDYFFANEKYRGHCSNGIDLEDAGVIDEILQRHPLTRFVSVDKELLEFSHEAWIHVDVLELEKGFERNPNSSSTCAPAFNFSCKKAVLTWNNSD